MSACLADFFGGLGIAAYAMGTDQHLATALDPFECVNRTFKPTPTTRTDFGSDRVGGVAKNRGRLLSLELRKNLDFQESSDLRFCMRKGHDNA